MSRSLVLEEFDLGGASSSAPGLPDLGIGGFGGMDLPDAFPAADAPSESPEEAYERGYRAGWDDCEAQAQEGRATVGAELSRNLQELGFTYHEARAHVMSGIEPLLQTLIGKVLPDLVAQTLGPAIVEELTAVAADIVDQPVTILVSEQSHEMVASFLDENTALPVKLVADPALGEWQVFFRLGDHERQLDLGEVLDRIAARFAAFKDQNDKVLKHG